MSEPDKEPNRTAKTEALEVLLRILSVTLDTTILSQSHVVQTALTSGRVLVSKGNVDERIAKLAVIQRDLEAAVDAVKTLRNDADLAKAEAEELRRVVQQIQEDKLAAEAMIKVPEEAVARVLHKASAKGLNRARLEGILIGFLTGLGSSLLATCLAQ